MDPYRVKPMAMNSPTIFKNNGFSLVELSIVLVILGLLVGGVIAGQSIIRASEIRSVIADYQRYSTASNLFAEKYSALPGDFSKATRYWGSKGGTGSDITCHQTVGSGLLTCNGDGDGQTNAISGDLSYGERFLAWQHMANAGFIEGKYTGTSPSAPTFERSPGVNIPQNKISNSFFEYVTFAFVASGDANWYDGSYYFNALPFGAVPGKPLTAQEAWSIDSKLDDGKPAIGSVFTYKSTSAWQTGCTTTDVVATAEYSVTSAGLLCALNFKM